MRFKPVLIAGLLTGVAASVAIPAAALAAAQPPAKAVPLEFYSGKWFEIARTPNFGQRDCQAPTTQFTNAGENAFKVVQVCRKGSPTGAAKTFSTNGRILAGSQNTRFTMSFLGGIKKQEYWVLDCAANGAWAIMGTPGGNYVWLISREAVMPEGDKEAALAKVKALGYAKLEFPQQPAA